MSIKAKNKKRQRWILKICFYCLFFGLFCGAIFHSPLLKFLILQQVSGKLNERFDVQLTARNWDLSLWAGKVSVVDMIIARTGLFYCQIPRLEVDLSLAELLAGKILIEDVRVHQPSFTLLSTEWPMAEEQPKADGQSRIAVDLQNFHLYSGRFRVRDMEIPLEGQVEAFQVRLLTELAGAYRELELNMGPATVSLHDETVRFSRAGLVCAIEPHKINLTSLWLESESLRAGVRGLVLPRNNIRYQFVAIGEGALDLLAATGRTLPVDLRGNVGFNLAVAGDGPGWPEINGRVHGGPLWVNDSRIHALEAAVHEEDGEISIRDLQCRIGDQGRLTGQVSISPLQEKRVDLDLRLSRVPLSEFFNNRLVHHPLRGTVSGEVTGRIPFTGPPHIEFNGGVRSFRVGLPNKTDTFDGNLLEGRFLYSNNQINFGIQTVQGEGVDVGGSGYVRGGDIFMDDLRVTAPRGEFLVPLIGKLVKIPPDVHQRLEQISLTGPVQAVGRFALTGSIPVIDATVSLEQIRVAQADWRQLDARLHLDPQTLRLEDINLRNESASATGLLGFRITPALELDRVQLEVDAFPVRSVERILTFILNGQATTRVPAGIDAQLRATGDIHRDQAAWQGDFWAQLTDLRIDDQPFGHLTLAGVLQDSEVRLREFQLQNEHVLLDGAGRWDFGADVLNVDGAIRRVIVQEMPRASDIGLVGELGGTYRLRGSAVDPEVFFDLRSPQFRFFEEPFGDLRLIGRLDSGKVDFSLRTDYRENLYNTIGTVHFGENPVLETTTFLDNVRVQPFLKLFKDPLLDEFRGQVTGQIFATYHFRTLEDLQVNAQLSEIRGEYRHLQIRNDETFNASVEKGRLTLDSARINVNGNVFNLDGQMNLFPPGDLQFVARGQAQVDVLQPFLPNIYPAGIVSVEAIVRGDPANPSLNGKVELNQVSFKLKALELPLTNISGTLRLSNDLVRADEITLVTPYGEAALSGEMQMDHFSPARWNATLRMDKVAVPFPEGFYGDASANLRFSGTTAGSVLTGDLWVERWSLQNNLDLPEFVALLAELDVGAAETDSSEFLRKTTLRVNLRGDRSLRLETDQINLTGSLDLQLRGNLANPVVRGNLLVNSGEVKYKMNRFAVERGNVLFNNPSRIDPELSFVFSSDIKDYSVQLNLEGTISQLKTRLTSVPSLPPVDIVRLITMGYLPTNSQQLSGEGSYGEGTALLSQVLSATVGQRLKRVIGIDTVSIDTYRTSSQTNPTARVTVGEQISPNLYVTYSRSISGEEQDLVFIEYRLSRRITVIASQDEKGYLGLDFRFRRRFR
ncbi:MAG: translocation/assembly module TamB domain-containing protein [Acidobacteria bacterium]|nr:translocation/assembly module TamB domain-containing protein [Acidobacteriota bacterium]